MNQRVIDYIKDKRIGVLAVEMLDGSPHGATVHFAFTQEPFVFYFETNKDYRKSEPLLKKGMTRASFVVGSDESNMATLQLDGVITLLKDEEREIYDTVYMEKFPEKKEKSQDPKFVRFTFVPKWWRLTDWTNPGGKLVITSDDKSA